MENNEQDQPLSEKDKDYGFPFVDVKPLRKEGPVELSQAENHPVEKEEGESISAAPAAQLQPVKSPVAPKSTGEKSRGTRPLLALLVLLLVGILASMAYFLYFTPSGESSTETVAVAPSESEEGRESAKLSEIIPADTTVVSDTLLIQEAPPASPVSPPSSQPQVTQSGSEGTLHLIEAKGERPVYYLVVASLPSERVAREEAQVFLAKGRDVWMIFPAGDTKNYRLSVGSFASFKSASDALPSAKADFTESTWILKY